MVLVAAPAGFGKTTLLAQWLAAAESSQRRVAWLALDPGDADLRLFLTHLAAAIQTVEPEAGVDALALLEAGATTPPYAVLVSLINDLDVLAGPTVVALDDYHAIDAAAVHEAATFLRSMPRWATRRSHRRRGGDPFSLSDAEAPASIPQGADFDGVRFEYAHEPVRYGHDLDAALAFVRGCRETSAALATLSDDEAARTVERLRNTLAAHYSNQGGVVLDSRSWLITTGEAASSLSWASQRTLDRTRLLLCATCGSDTSYGGTPGRGSRSRTRRSGPPANRTELIGTAPARSVAP